MKLPEKNRWYVTWAIFRDFWTSKYGFFELGVRRVCAEEGAGLNFKLLGPLFEQGVGLELRRLMQLNSQNGMVKSSWSQMDRCAHAVRYPAQIPELFFSKLSQ